MQPTPHTRRYDVDWLRVFATYLLFVFHVAMVFNPAPFYHIRNHDLSFAMLVFDGFIGLWHMPLFFLLAGWSILASLQVRGTSGFLRERLSRLLIPLVAACIVMMPVIKYLELSSGLDLNHRGLWVSAELQAGFATVIPGGLPLAAPFHEGFRAFLPTFFTRLDRFTWAHLWFVAYLFTFTVLYLPLFAALARSRRELVRVPGWWVYLPVIPLAVIQITLRPRWPGIQNLYDDWANVAYYTTFVLAGFLLARYPALERALGREWRRALAIALATTGALLLAVLGVIRTPSLLLAGSAVAGWCFIVALLGFARERLMRPAPVLAYLTESAFPVYILHQIAIVGIGYWLVRLPLGIPAKFTLLLVASVAATLGVYHFVVRPTPALRFLFGMKPKTCALAVRPIPRSVAAAILAMCALAAGGPTP